MGKDCHNKMKGRVLGHQEGDIYAPKEIILMIPHPCVFPGAPREGLAEVAASPSPHRQESVLLWSEGSCVLPLAQHGEASSV